MALIKLGNTDLEITEIAFGAWAIGGWMWGGNDKKDSLRALDASVDMGITSIDTAPIYGFGYSEEIVGESIQGKRDRVQILTKFGMRWEIKQGKHFFSSEKNDGTPVDIYKYAGKESILKECEESLKRLKTDYIDLYQIHWPDVTTPIEESMEAVELLIKQGKVRAAGVSNYSTEDMKKAGTVINLASNQVAYSMVKRDIEEDIVPYSIENNVGILVYSPLQRGVLAGKIKPDTKFNNGDHRPTTAHYKNDNIIKINLFLEQIRPLAELKDVSLAQLVLRWTLQRPGISCILAGARNEEQLIENAGTLEFELSGEEMESIDHSLEKLVLNLEE
ncbi:MAG TPA: aldo/keto reductase [Bacteroides sp.]|nr:aldo/keto reductase [Bacteroides sp.]